MQKVKEEDVRNILTVHEGQVLTDSNYNPGNNQKKLQTIPGVKEVQVATVCCDAKGGGWMIYIGIREGDVNEFKFNPAPAGNEMLPYDILQTSWTFDSLWHVTVMAGLLAADNSKGHALLTYPPAIPVQEKMVRIANKDVALLRQVMKNSSNADHRATATLLIAYGDNKKDIVPDLLQAVHDRDQAVRNNATRALSVLGDYAVDNPGSGINIPAEPFISMIHSIMWTDRNKGVALLESITRNRDSVLLNELRLHALPQLIEMARWKDTGHAFYSFVILGRIAGASDEEIIKQLYSDTKNSYVDSLLVSIKAKN